MTAKKECPPGGADTETGFHNVNDTTESRKAPVRRPTITGQAMKAANTGYRTNTSFGVDSTTQRGGRQDKIARFNTNGEIFQQAKDPVTMPQAAEMYGYEPNRAGFIRCPFHGGGGERTPSCKLWDDHFYCFGCKTGGSVIDFTARLFDLSPLDAVRRLNTDFALGLSLDRHAPTAAELAAARKRQEVRDALESFNRWRKSALDLLARAIGVGNDALIHRTMDGWTEAECLAVREKERLEWFYEELDAGDDETQLACLRAWEEVSRIATRVCGK